MNIKLRKTSRALRIFVFAYFITVVLLASIVCIGTSEMEKSSINDTTSRLNSSFLPLENYTSILNAPEQGLGMISITGLSFHEEGFNFISAYGDLTDDLYYGALNVTYQKTKFIGQITPASEDNLNSKAPNRNIITVRLNETVRVDYNHSKWVSEEVEDYLIYGTRLVPCKFVNLYIQEVGETSVTDVGEGNYSIDNNNFLIFNYFHYFYAEKKSFEMHIIWDYNVTIENWGLNQRDSGELTLHQQKQNISVNFNYAFDIVGKKYNETLTGTYPFENDQKLAKNLYVVLKIQPPDRTLLYDYDMKINNQKIAQANHKNYLIEDNKTIRFNTSANSIGFSLNFTADYEFSFDDAVYKYWAIDRLLLNNNIRERYYFPNITKGPARIYVKNVRFFENTIAIDQVQENSTLFGRSVALYDANITQISEEIKNSLIFNANVTKKKGLEVYLPYMITGEVCPFSFKYIPTENLRIIVSDNTNMPLYNVEVRIYYYGARYGSYMTKSNVQPYPPAITDENGEVLVYNVPNGNYTLEIYQGGIKIGETTVSAYSTSNYIFLANIIHFPVWIIIFSLICGGFLAIGIYYFLNFNRSKRT